VAYRFRAELWRYEGDAAWHFVTLPSGVSDDISDRPDTARRGFGSVRVNATIGSTTWATSIFPDSKAGTFLLPVKTQVRDAESIDDGDVVDVTLDLA